MENTEVENRYLSPTEVDSKPTYDQSRFLPILFLGVLSMHFAEVFSGASPLWFLTIWAWIVTLPLYLSHTLLFLNIALYTKKYSLPHLYLFGVIFGLYESWITKVLWSGYPNDDPIMGLVGGIAIFEFVVLVLYYHNIYSFIMPILAFEIFCMYWNGDELQSPLMQQVGLDLRNPRKLKFMAGFVVLFGAPILGFTSGPVIGTITVLGSLAIIFILDRLVKRKVGMSRISIETLKLGRKGMTRLSLFILLFYVVAFFGLVPEKLPNSALPYLIIIAMYLLVILILVWSPPVQPTTNQENILLDTFDRKRVYLFVLLFWFLMALSVLTGGVALIIAFLMQISILVFGPFLFFKAVQSLYGGHERDIQFS